MRKLDFGMIEVVGLLELDGEAEMGDGVAGVELAECVL